MTVSTGGLRPRRARRQGGIDRDFGLDGGNVWPQPTYVPGTAPGVSVLDDFNSGATQQLHVRPGWDNTSKHFAGSEIDWTTDATPTVATMSASPTFGHSNYRLDLLPNDQEVSITIGAAGATPGDLQLMSNSDVMTAGTGNQTEAVFVLQADGNFRLGGITAIATRNYLFGAPAAGDSFCLQREGPYVFGWRRLAAGQWTLLLSAASTFFGAGRIGFWQAGSGTYTIDAVGGGPLQMPARAKQITVPRTWARN